MNGAPSAKTESVGVIVPDQGWALCSDPALPRALQGIEEVLSEHGIQMLLLHAYAAGGLERFLAGGHIGALIVVSVPESSDLAARIDGAGLPVVFGGRPKAVTNVTFVDVDEHAAGRCATQHLIELGRRRIAHIAGPQGIASTSDRLQGFREAMWDAALRSDLVEHGGLDRDSGELAMTRLLNFRDDIDAVFAASDAMAAGAMWAMQVLGRRVPDDVAIIGFDDSPLAAKTSPPLSSVHRPIEDMGREMARLVVEMASSGRLGEPRQLILDPAVAVRASTMAAGSI